jgi:hypothetical protein
MLSANNADLCHLRWLSAFLPYCQISLQQPEGAYVLHCAQALPPHQEVVSGCGLSGGRRGVPVVEPDDAFAVGQRENRMSRPLDGLERADAGSDREGMARPPTTVSTGYLTSIRIPSLKSSQDMSLERRVDFVMRSTPHPISPAGRPLSDLGTWNRMLASQEV